MSAILPHLTLRREALLQVLSVLPPIDIAVLLYVLATRVCPTTGRAWAKPGWIATHLKLTDGLARRALEAIARTGIVRIFTVHGDLYGLELGRVFVRHAEAPDNLPVEPPG